MNLRHFERFFLDVPRGVASRVRLFAYRCLGLTAGRLNRMEAARCRRLSNIVIGDYNAFTAGCWLWPLNSDFQGTRIRIGSNNYFNRNVMIDACGYVEIGDNNMFGPEVYITDSNHRFGLGVSPASQAMSEGKVKIGSHCWIGAKAVILKDVELGDYCTVAAGAVVTRSFPAASVVAGVPARLLRTTDTSQPAFSSHLFTESEKSIQ
jgi:acetyltransferase-like isoleucine patch superfamily enzyme